MKKEIEFRGVYMTLSLEGNEVTVTGRMKGKTFNAEVDSEVFHDVDSPDRNISRHAKWICYSAIYNRWDAYSGTL